MRAVASFLKTEAAGGVVLFAAAILAVILDNSPLAAVYRAFRDWPLGSALAAGIPLHVSLRSGIDDGLMALFFLLVGLEIKREMLEGELARGRQVLLPALAALVGMAVPGLLYAAINLGSPATLRGWAIPAATDIAFALGVLALLGSRVPLSLRLFLTAVAIFDDLGAILIIAFFYGGRISLTALLVAAVLFGVLILFNRRGVRALTPYLLVGLALWWFVLLSGVQATVAGVLLAFAIPLRAGPAATRNPPAAVPSTAPLRRLEGALHPWVAFGVLPLFAFTNAGVSFGGVTLATFGAPVTLGIAVGLFLGKQAAIFGTLWLLVRLNIAPKPAGASWPAVYGVAVLCGIGFTMSLFIGGLAFPGTILSEEVRYGVIAGSLLSAALGYSVLFLSRPRRIRVVL